MNTQSVRSYNPYLYIWGAQWITQALLAYFWNLEPQSIAVTVTIGLAALLSALLFVVRWNRGRTATVRRNDAPRSQPTTHRAIFLVPLCFVLVSIGLLLYVAPESYMLYDLLRALGLAFFYIVIGLWLGRELVYLGLWLFALTVIVSIWFLGFAPLVLLFFGGLSLLACAVIFRLWARSAA